MSDGLHIERRDDHITVLTLDRPPHNFFDRALVGEIADACEQAERDGARALLLRATGRVFCAGADFGESGDVELDPESLYREAVRLFRRSLPMVAEVHGAAIGGGTGLALAADLRVVSPAARFAVNFAQIGIHHGFGLTATLPRAVGEQKAMDLLLTGRRIDGREAYRVGLADRLVEAEELPGAALELAGRIAAGAPLAVRSIRRTMRESLADEVEQAIVREAREQRVLFGTEDFREGVRAVSERRPGRFAGR